MEQEQKIISIKIEKLKPHPKNIEIYGKDDVTDLIDNIKKYGVLSPIITT